VFDYFKDGFWHGVAYWIYDMQGFLAALAAFIAAGIILWHRRDDRLRRLWFAKSAANFAVVDIHGFLKSTVKNLEEDYFRFKKTVGTGVHFEKFKLTPCLLYPDDSLKAISALIPVSNERTASQLAELTSFFQIYKSRLISFEEQCANASHATSINDFHGKVYEQVELSSWLMQRLLPYVRDMKLYKMPNFKKYPDASLTFDTKKLFHDADYNKFCEKKSWPPNLQMKMKKWLERNK
jgi:hypothetical protein